MDLDCKDGTCPIDGNKGKQTIRSGKSCLPCSGYKRYSTSNGFGKDSSSSGRLPRDEKKTSIGTGSGTIRKDATTPSLPAPRGDVIVPERATGPTGTTVGANSNPKRDVIRVGEGKGVVTGAATDGGASRPVSMPTANISGGTADAIGGTPARSGRASKGAIVTPAITDAVTTSSVIRTAAPTIPVVRMPSSSSITGLNIPKGVGREISINLPPSVSAKQPSPRGDVVTPKQAAPFVLAPIAPLATQQPRPDYCDATGMNELIACQRGSDGTFPAVSSACAQSFRDLLARGLSVAEIISDNELCSDEFRRLLAGATPVLIEPPKQGAPVAAAKGMPLAVAAPTMIVAPGGAPTAVNPVQCMAMFLALPSAAQASIVGAYPCPMARSLAPEIARGSRAAAADFVQWFGSAFRPESAEVSRFCAMTLSARGVAAAGALSFPSVYGVGHGTISIFGMPHYGRVFNIRADNQLNELTGSWVDPKTQTTWQVTVPAGPSAGFILRPDGMYTTFELNVSPSGAAIVNLANARWFPVDKFMNDLFYRASHAVAPSGAILPADWGIEPGSGFVTIFGMPHYARVFLVDGYNPTGDVQLRELTGSWVDPKTQTTWQVTTPRLGWNAILIRRHEGLVAGAEVIVSARAPAIINAANLKWRRTDAVDEATFARATRGVTPGGAPGGIVVHGRAYVQPAGAAKGGMGAAIQSPRGYQGAPMGRTPTLVGISRLGIAHMPPYGRVLIDGLVVEEGEWDRNSPSTWNVRIASGSPHHVVVQSPSGEQRDAGYLTAGEQGATIDWNALAPNTISITNDQRRGAYSVGVSPLTSPGSTGTAVYNAKAAGAPGGKSMVLAGPNGYQGVVGPRFDVLNELAQLVVHNMPHGGIVLIDGVTPEGEGRWLDSAMTRWLVPILGGRHHVVVRDARGEQRDAGYLAVGPLGVAIDWNALRSVSPLTSPGSTGTAVYNAKAAGAPGGKSMVLAGPSGRSPFAQAGSSPAMVPASNRIMQVNAVRSPSSVAPGVASQGAGPSVAQCLQTLRAIASRDPRAIVAAFHQSGLDAIVPSRPGSGDSAADVLALIDDCAARRQQYPRQFDAFCHIAAALSGVKPGGDPAPDMTFSGDEAAEADRLAAKGASLADAPSSEPKSGQHPGSSGPSASQIIGGIGSIATTGIGVLNSYLDRESAQHIEALRQNASSANERTRQNALIEIERIRAASAERIAALGPNPSPQAVADVLNRTTNPSTSNQPPAQGMSTGTTVALAAGGVAIVGGIAYLALSKKGR